MKPNIADLTRPKSKAKLSESTNRDELVKAGICVACRAFPALSHSVHCRTCGQRLAAADSHAFKGFWAEMRKV